MSWLGFAQYGGKVATTEAEPLLNPSGDRYFQSVVRYAKTIAVHPKRAGAVIDLVHSTPESAVGIDNFPRDSYLFSCVSSGIARDFGDGVSRGTPQKRE